MMLQIIALIAGGIILWRSEPALNRMGPGTPTLIRLAFLLLTLGAIALVIYVLAGNIPDSATVLLTAGLAMLLFCERCMHILLPRQKLRQ